VITSETIFAEDEKMRFDENEEIDLGEDIHEQRESVIILDDYFELKTRIANERAALREKHRLRAETVDVGEKLGVRDPLRARHKGCGRRAVTSRGKSQRVHWCRKCGNAGTTLASVSVCLLMTVRMLQRPPQIGRTWMWSRRRMTWLKQMMLMNSTYKGDFSVSCSEDAAYSV
ncbi:hypothetical protein S245_033934, partial [Arachis hypogaea]